MNTSDGKAAASQAAGIAEGRNAPTERVLPGKAYFENLVEYAMEGFCAPTTNSRESSVSPSRRWSAVPWMT
jgi:hypothetical protein